mmetsp:Transcript_18043/g.36419  ORF Transcript_18043/g.36419 Transcript_18043/m.36419 type:complete len:107 (+) Transcript_18043:172-492(+)
MCIVDLVGDVVTEMLTLAHFVHLWLTYGVSLTLIDLFLFMNMRKVIISMTRHIVAFKGYTIALHHMEYSLPDVILDGEEEEDGEDHDHHHDHHHHHHHHHHTLTKC